MDFGLLFVLLGVGAVFALTDMFSSSGSDSDTPDPENSPDQDTDAPVDPPDDAELPDGVDVIEDPETGALTFVITDAFSGSGVLSGVPGMADILDLSEFSGNASVTESDQGDIFLEIEGESTEPTLLTGINEVILGPGDNVVNVGSVPGGFGVTATEGTNSITAWRGLLDVTLLGGTNSVDMADSGTLTVAIAGGENRIVPDEDVSGTVTILAGATGETTLDTEAFIPVVFEREEPGLQITPTEASDGAIVTWETGRITIVNGTEIIVPEESAGAV